MKQFDTYLINSPQRHHENSDQEIRDSETKYQIVRDWLEVSVQENGHHHKNIP